MRRMHERVLAEGTFRLALTDKHRLVAAVDAETALGPVHLAFEVDHRLRFGAQRASLERSLLGHDVGFSLPSIDLPKIKVPDVVNAAEHAFDAATKIAPIVAMPALSLVHAAALDGAQRISHAASFLPLPPDAKDKLEAAARIMNKARLGDVDARKFVGRVLHAARQHVPAARAIADKLVAANRLLDHAVAAAQDASNPTKKAERLFAAIQRGDWKAVRSLAEHELSNIEGAAALLPGLGTGVAAALAAATAALDGGKPLEIALRTAYGALPIPPAIRQITDGALDAVLALVGHGGTLTDAAVAAARDAIPSGPARDVFDVLMRVVASRVSIQKAGLELLEHYVRQYAGTGVHGISLPSSVAHFLPAPSAA